MTETPASEDNPLTCSSRFPADILLILNGRLLLKMGRKEMTERTHFLLPFRDFNIQIMLVIVFAFILLYSNSTLVMDLVNFTHTITL